jgi:hypothetical protein
MKKDMVQTRTGGQDHLMELLTIDADAHLEKLAAHIFPSPALLPVELVRSSLKRKAAAVSIHVRPDRIVISDNGSRIDSAEWHALSSLADSGQSTASREKAIAHVQGLARPGIGLLAVFVPGVRSLQIETSGPSGAGTMRMTAGRVVLLNNSSWPLGTRITLTRRRGPAAEEKTLLVRLCAATDAKIEINGRQLKKRPLLTNNLASMNIAVAGNARPSLLAIPAQGDVCRIWLLDQGIPWQVTAMAPVQGLVFSAVLEATSQLMPAALETLASNALHLYQWLAENHVKFSEQYQSRIEELFFKQVRSGADPVLLSICAPFRLWRSQRRIPLADVRRQAMNGILYAMDYDGQPCHGNAPGREVLVLTSQQKDFLINHLRLPIVMLGTQQKTRIRPRKFFAFCRDKLLGWQRLHKPARDRILDSSRLSLEENNLCLELEMQWRRKSSLPLSVAMIEGRGFFPACRFKNEYMDMLLIRRGHPLTRQSLQRISQDRNNSELAFVALMPGFFLTDDSQ